MGKTLGSGCLLLTGAWFISAAGAAEQSSSLQPPAAGTTMSSVAKQESAFRRILLSSEQALSKRLSATAEEEKDEPSETLGLEGSIYESVYSRDWTEQFEKMWRKLGRLLLKRPTRKTTLPGKGAQPEDWTYIGEETEETEQWFAETWFRHYYAPRKFYIWQPNHPYVTYHYRSGVKRYTPEEESPAEDEEKEEKEEEELALTKGSSSASAPAAATFAPMPDHRASIALSTADATVQSDNSATSPTAGDLIWTGAASSAWNAGDANWVSKGSTTATAFGAGSSNSVFFSNTHPVTGAELTEEKKNITLASNVSLAGMTIAGGGYTFSGDGDLSISGSLEIYAQRYIGTLGAVSSGDVVFGAGNAITAGSIILAADESTTTTFNGSVTAGSLTISNSQRSPEVAGTYIFNDAVTVNGAADINLGLAVGLQSGNLLLDVNSSFTAASLALGGTARKEFDGTVTTSGDLSISGQVGAEVGETIFRGDVSVGGGLSLSDNASVVIEGSLTTKDGISLGGSTLSYNKATATSTHDLGTITLTADDARLNLGENTTAKASISSNGTAAYNFTLGGNAAGFEATLASNISDLSITGGTVSLTAASTGQLTGDLSVSDASLTVGRDTLFATGASGAVSISNAAVDFGSTSQALYGPITLNQGSLSGSNFSAAGETLALNYSGSANSLTGNLALGSAAFSVTSQEAGSALTLTGNISGTGSLSFSGQGTTSIQSALSHAGEVSISDGASLVLSENKALAYASKVTVGSGSELSVINNGSSAELNGTGGLVLEDGAILTLSNLVGHEDTAALTLSGAVSLNGALVLNLNETDASKTLANYTEYTLLAAGSGISDAITSLTVYANGQQMAAYKYSYKITEGTGTDSKTYLTFTRTDCDASVAGDLVWTGASSSNWNTTTENWVKDGSATTFSSATDKVFFGNVNDFTGDFIEQKSVSLSADTTVAGMTVAGSGYAFTGSTLTVSGTLDVHANGSTSFANNLIATTMKLASEVNTTTTFGGTVSAGSLSISNGLRDAEHAGNYVFEEAVTVSGAATINVGSADTGASGKTLLQVKGAFSAASLTLGGSAMKVFAGDVTTTGDLTITGVNEGAHNGTAYFGGVVSVGNDFILKDKGSASFGNDSNLTVTGDIYMSDATLTFTKFTQASVYDFGTIYLMGDGAQLNIDPLTRVKATVSSVEGGTYDFTIGGSPRQFDLTLNGVSDLNVQGGTVTVTDASTGQLYGNLSVSGIASVTLAGDNIFAAPATNGTADTGNIQVSSASLNLGETEQNLYGDIALSSGSVSGGTLTATENLTLAYSGSGNIFSSALSLGSYNLAVSAPEAAGEAGAAHALTISGDITGSGSLSFAGAGTTTLSCELAFTGQVYVGSLYQQGEDGSKLIAGSGSTLVLASDNALKNATKITVGKGANLSVVHGGSSVVLDGAGVLSGETQILGADGNYVQQMIGLEIEHGATLTFTNLSGYEDIPAITLQGGLLFHGGVTINFIEEDGSKLTNLHTYELITSEVGINSVANSPGGVSVIANGNTTPLDSSQYEFSYYKEGNTRHFIFTMLAGKRWVGGASGEWHKMAEGDYVNWSAGAVGDTALFRTQTDSSTGATIADVSITTNAQSGTTSLYMDGESNYTISAASGFTEAMFKKEDVLLIKKGGASMTFSNLTVNLGDIDVNDGKLVFTAGSTLSSTGTITVDDLAYKIKADGSTELSNAATLSLEKGSTLEKGAATITGYGDNAAELHGVILSGVAATAGTSGSSTTAFATISGYSSGLAGTTETPSTHAVHNAAIDSFALDNLTLTGTGSLESVTINENVTIGSGASYTLGDDIAVLSTITNNGTVVVTENSLIGVGRLGAYVESTDGLSTTYTAISGTGTISGWDALTVDNFRIRGTDLNRINDISVNVSVAGQVTVSSSTVKFLRWDSVFNENSWTVPTVGLLVTSPSTSADFSVATDDYAYSERVKEGDANTYVASVNSGVGNAGYSLIGAKISTSGAGLGSEEAPVNIWISDDGSAYGRYIAGAGAFSRLGGTYYGDSHLQLSRSSTSDEVAVIGGSQNTIQVGNSYLTLYSGKYSTVVGGNSHYQLSGVSGASMDDTYHKGSSNVHVVDGSITTLYGGSQNTYTMGDSYVLVEGGSITTLYGGDYSTESSTHTGNITVDLKGGTVTNVYGGGNTGNASQVSGNIHINLYAGADGNMLTSGLSVLDGGSGTIISGSDYHSALVAASAGSYDLTGATIQNFDRLELVEGAEVSVSASTFNSTGALTISGPGQVTLTGSGKTSGDLTVKDGATIWVNLSIYNGFSAEQKDYTALHIESGSTADVSGRPSSTHGGDLAVKLYLAGDGTDGQGALFKSGSIDDIAVSSCVSLPLITLTDHASVQAEGSAAIYMIPYQVTTHSGSLDLTNGGTSADARGYIFTKKGQGTFGMFNTDVTGGTLNVAEGILSTSHSSYAPDTDLVLHSGTTLQFSKEGGNLPEDDSTASTNNGFAVESLSGEGAVQLGSAGWLYLSMNKKYTGFHEDFGAYNDKGYTYGVYSGQITGAGQVTKAGDGKQEFSGSESTYSGITHVAGGIFYLSGTSTATDFDQAVLNTSSSELQATTKVSSGAIGTGFVQWEGGALYLGDDTRIYNASAKAYNTANTVIGVYGGEELSDGSYHDATYSGVIETEHTLQKVGLGTLTFDQLGIFDAGAVIEGGTLNLCGWADADKYTISQARGTTLMFSYDATYGTEETSEIASALQASGTGDARWLTESRTDKLTAAIISAIGANKVLTLSGVISDGTELEVSPVDELDGSGQTSSVVSGNLLHSGEGTLILAGKNTYSGGTTITDGLVRVQSDTGLGATAAGLAANLVTWAGSQLELAAGTSVTLAAVKTVEGDETLYAGNHIRGTVVIGDERSRIAGNTQLTMAGDGYYAERTELPSRSVLLFRGENASNWDKESSYDAAVDMSGAGTLAGSGTLVVANADTTYANDSTGYTDAEGNTLENRGTGTSVSFNQVESLTQGETSFTGNLVLEGDKTLLNIASGDMSGGSYSISGNGAMVNAESSEVTVVGGATLSLTSMGDAGTDAGSTATFAAKNLTVQDGATLAVTRAETSFSEAAGLTAAEKQGAAQVSVGATMKNFSHDEKLVAHESYYDFKFDTDGVDKDWAGSYHHYFEALIAVNPHAAGALDVAEGSSVTLDAGAIYQAEQAHISLSGSQLTLNVTTDVKIHLALSQVLGAYLDDLDNAAESEKRLTKQWVLFSDVGEFQLIIDGVSVLSSLDAEAQIAALMDGLTTTTTNTVYATQANSVFYVEGVDSSGAVRNRISDNVLLVYDAGAGVVYLDRTPNNYDAVPEPTTATLSLLALTALAARRRRRA